ncbi:MAG TPA: zinc ribbon domain-containing protein [Bryobacteraceae bacterium]|jgi:putative FmdB family regulatory protein
MPIYDYQCRSCGEEFELLVLKGTVAACPSCQSEDLEQMLSGFAVSTEAMTKARVKAARSRYMSSSTYKDKKIAEMDEIREHSPQSFSETKKK